MKHQIRKVSWLILLVISLHGIAQEGEQVVLRCTYETVFTTIKGRPRSDQMVLDLGKTTSEFYSLGERQVQQVRDRFAGKGASSAEIMQAVDALGIKRSYIGFTVYKHIPQPDKLLYVDKLLIKFSRYEEAMERPVWKMEEDRKEVAGYVCQKATAHFRGRDWTAWFTDAIPISDGPWKLWGLPGLILEATEREGDYLFSCIGLEEPTEALVINIPKRLYVKCTREQFLKEEYALLSDIDAYVKKELGFTPKSYSADGKLMKREKIIPNNIER